MSRSSYGMLSVFCVVYGLLVCWSLTPAVVCTVLMVDGGCVCVVLTASLCQVPDWPSGQEDS